MSKQVEQSEVYLVVCPCTAVNVTWCAVSPVICWNCREELQISDEESEIAWFGERPSRVFVDEQNPNVCPF